MKVESRDGKLTVSPPELTALFEAITEHDYGTPPVPGMTWYWVLVEDMGRFISLHSGAAKLGRCRN